MEIITSVIPVVPKPENWSPGAPAGSVETTYTTVKSTHVVTVTAIASSQAAPGWISSTSAAPIKAVSSPVAPIYPVPSGQPSGVAKPSAATSVAPVHGSSGFSVKPTATSVSPSQFTGAAVMNGPAVGVVVGVVGVFAALF
jgi:hypothetical protein